MRSKKQRGNSIHRGKSMNTRYILLDSYLSLWDYIQEQNLDPENSLQKPTDIPTERLEHKQQNHFRREITKALKILKDQADKVKSWN